MIKRPILIITICYIIGIIMGLYFKINIALFVCGCTTVFGLFWLLKRKINYIQVQYKTILIIEIMAILTLTCSYMFIRYKENKYEELYKQEAKEISYVATIISDMKESEYYYSYEISIKYINNQINKNDINYILKIKKDKTMANNCLKYGDRICGKGILEAPEIQRNYKGFDYSKYLKTKNIALICTSKINDIKILKNNSLPILNMWINNIRNKCKTNLNKLLPEDTSKIANSFLLGDTKSLDLETREMFSNASLSHILAISGMHVGYVIMMLNIILKKVDNRKGKIISIVVLIFFSQLTGSSPSILRAVIMSGLVITSKLFFRKSDIVNNIAISCLIILIFNPYSILNLGFQLSFLGTLGIVILNPKLKKFLNINKIEKRKEENGLENSFVNINFILKIITKIKLIIITSLSANILIMPILIYNYNNISFIFIISNMLVAPILGIMSILGYCTIILSTISMNLAKIMSVFLDIIIKIFNCISFQCSKISILKFTVTTPNIIFMILYYIIIFYLCIYYQKKHNKYLKKIFIFFLIISIISNTIIYVNKTFKIYFIDVAQGDSCLVVTTTNKVILIDGGGSENSNYDIGKNILVPYLLDRGIRKIDYVIISHFDTDHVRTEY